MTIARTPAEVIAGEAVSGTPEQRWNDMLNIASVIANRAAMLGVPVEDVVSAITSTNKEFDAYNKSLPAGVDQSIIDMAQAALDQVQTQGPVNNATFYATPNAVDGLPKGLQVEAETDGHIFKSDPAMRAIMTADGLKKPDPAALPSLASADPLQRAVNAPYEANGLINASASFSNLPAEAVPITSVPASALDPAFSPSGLLSGNFPASKFTAPSANMGILATQDQNLPSLGPALNSFAPVAAATPVSTRFQNQWEAMASAPPVGDATGISVTSLPTGQSDVAAGNFDPARMANSSALARVMQTPSAYLDAPEPHPNVNNFGLLAAALPVQAPLNVSGVIGNPTNMGLQANTRVPMSASLFSPAIESPQAVMPAMTSNMGVLATGDNLLGTQPSVGLPSMGILATKDFNLGPMTPAQNNWAALASAPPVQAPTVGGINSPEMQAMREKAAQHLAEMEQARLAAQTYDPVAAFTASPTTTAAETAIGAVAAPSTVPNQYATPSYSQLPASSIPALSQPVVDANNPFASSPGILSAPAQTISNVPSSLLSSTPLESQSQLSAISPSSSLLSPSLTQTQSFTPTVTAPPTNGIPMANVQAAADYSMLNSGYHLPTANVPALASDGLLSAPASIQSVISPTSVPGSNIPSLNAPNFQMTQTPMQTPSAINVADDPAVSMPSLPSLETVSVPDQPSIAATTDTQTITGPANTPAVAQQQSAKLSGAFPAAPAKTGMLGGLLNKGTLTGGLLGTLAAGPIGGVLGGLLGNAVNKNGGLTGLLGGQPPSLNQINGGMQNLAGIWGGSYPAGTTATANNGDQVTSMGNGWTTVTNQFGVTTSFGPNQVTASYWGPAISSDSSRTPSGPPGGGGGVGGFGSLL
jgi:hypothetical protein